MWSNAALTHHAGKKTITQSEKPDTCEEDEQQRRALYLAPNVSYWQTACEDALMFAVWVLNSLFDNITVFYRFEESGLSSNVAS